MSAANLPGRMSRDEFKKARELEELRKSGAAPPEVDDEGAMINPHIPEYISKSPWYLNNNRPGLKHQKSSSFAPGAPRDGPAKATFTEHYQRGKAAAAAAPKPPAKFLPGSCTNCGSTTHKLRDCLERPRAKGAAVTGQNIAAPDVIQSLEFSYDAKRDRWAGYDTKEYSKVIRRFETTELERKKKKLQELEQAFEEERKAEKQRKEEEERRAAAIAAGEIPAEAAAARAAEGADGASSAAAAAGADGAAAAAAPVDPAVTEARRLRDLKKRDRMKKQILKAQLSASANNPGGAAGGGAASSDSDSDDDEMADDGEVMQKKAGDARMTVRNLRIREDTAKYLRNLDPNSAHYDPKTRSMRENPYEGIKDPNDVMYAGDNFVRKQGATKDIQALQSFVWEAAERGSEGVHVQALPSQAEKLFQEYKMKKEALKDTRKTAILNKYGNSAEGAASAAAAGSASGSTSAALPKELLLQVSESYVEYDETGRVIKGLEKSVPKTKYLEDVFENGHKAVWGSYYKVGSSSGTGGMGSWGYKCCHQTIRHSVCTGEAGKAAAAEMAAAMGGRMSFKDAQDEALRAKQASAAEAATAAATSSAAAAVAAPSSAAAAMRTDSPDRSGSKSAAAPSKRKRRSRSRSRSRSSSSSRSRSTSSSSSGSSRSGSSSSSSGSSSSSSSGSSSDSDSDSGSGSDSDSDSRSKKKKRSSSRSRKSKSSSIKSKDRSSKSSSKSKGKQDRKKAKTEKTDSAASASASSSAAGGPKLNRSGYNRYDEKDVIPDEKEMEAYYRNKRSAEDPMNNMPKDALLE